VRVGNNRVERLKISESRIVTAVPSGAQPTRHSAASGESAISTPSR
jgi:hypothetical protein